MYSRSVILLRDRFRWSLGKTFDGGLATQNPFCYFIICGPIQYQINFLCWPDIIIFVYLTRLLMSAEAFIAWCNRNLIYQFFMGDASYQNNSFVKRYRAMILARHLFPDAPYSYYFKIFFMETNRICNNDENQQSSSLSRA